MTTWLQYMVRINLRGFTLHSYIKKFQDPGFAVSKISISVNIFLKISISVKIFEKNQNSWKRLTGFNILICDT